MTNKVTVNITISAEQLDALLRGLDDAIEVATRQAEKNLAGSDEEYRDAYMRIGHLGNVKSKIEESVLNIVEENAQNLIMEKYASGYVYFKANHHHLMRVIYKGEDGRYYIKYGGRFIQVVHDHSGYITVGLYGD